MNETWKDIKNFKKYQISNLANFRRLDRIAGNIRHKRIFVYYTNYSKFGYVKLNNEQFLVENLYQDTFELGILNLLNKGFEIFIPKPENKPIRLTLNGKEKDKSFLPRIRNRSRFNRGLNFGVTKYYHDNDNLAEEIEWKDKVAQWIKTYYKSGELKSHLVEQWRKTYYKSGKLKSQIDYVDGEMRDEITWDENGDLMNGFIQSFYENGILSEIHTFKEGKPHGIEKSWHENGQLKYEVNYFEGERVGYDVSYDFDGVIKGKDYFKNGLLHGVSREWGFSLEAESSILIKLNNYKEGELHGCCKKWHENGLLASESYYYKGELNGPCKYFDKEGLMWSNELYLNGVRQKTKTSNN